MKFHALFLGSAGLGTTQYLCLRICHSDFCWAMWDLGTTHFLCLRIGIRRMLGYFFLPGYLEAWTQPIIRVPMAKHQAHVRFHFLLSFCWGLGSTHYLCLTICIRPMLGSMFLFSVVHSLVWVVWLNLKLVYFYGLRDWGSNCVASTSVGCLFCC